jgi:hypothetical protein
MTLTEASLDALRLWVETSADPRDLVASNYSNTIALQQLEERVGTRLDALEAALATLRLEASASTSDRQPSPDNIQYDSSITSVIQESEAALTADGTAKREGYGALAGQVQAYATQH